MSHERLTGMKPLVALFALGLVAGCARTPAVRSADPARSATVRALRTQLAGHLERARGCLTEAPRRDPEAGGLVRYGFTIRPDGRVSDVEVDAWSSEEGALAACVRSRMVSLYFDPAPPREVRIERSFDVCPDDGTVCRLSLEGAGDGLRTRAEDGLAARDDELLACAAREGGEALLEVRLELGADGRIMAGRLERAEPAATPLRRCAVGPLLGARVEGEPPGEDLELRYVFRLGAEGDGRTAAR